MEGVLEEFWEAKNLDFRSFFEEKSKTKMVDVLEGPKKPSRRGKKQSPEALRTCERVQVEVVLGQVACRRGRGGTTNTTNGPIDSLSNTPLGQRPGELSI